MKKVLLTIIVGGIVVLSSCSKKGDYTCSCVKDGVAAGVNTYELKDQKEEEAEDLCKGYESSSSENGFVITNTTPVTCTLR